MLGAAFGGTVREAPEIRHGKVSLIQHQGSGLFESMPQELPIMRYHSLAIEPESLPACFEIEAEAIDDGSIMAIKHRDFPVYGLQFHPESIGTPDGDKIMEAFVSYCRRKLIAQ